MATTETLGAGAPLVKPLLHHGKAYYAFVSILSSILALGTYAYYTQLNDGLVVTGMRNQVLWGLYITNFVFFIGISHVGALMSAILRLTGAEWRRPITRMAEAITFCSLVFGALMPIIDLGRPDRIVHLILYGRIQSPILWDLISIGTYLTGSTVFLLLPMIPDIALLRDRLSNASPLRQWLYRVLSLGWRGEEEQKKHLEKAIAVMTVLILPIAISVHTVVSWIFSMQLRTGWNSTIFGPYFVAGALFSGVASVIMAMALFRRFYHLEDFITMRHFHNLGKLLLALDIVYIYFTISEYLTVSYKWSTDEGELLAALYYGPYSVPFMFVQVGGLLIPAILMAAPKTRTIAGYFAAATLINVAMWVKRFVIIVPTLALPQLPYEWAHYQPTWIEWSITAGAFAGFVLLYTVFSRVFPIVSIWETVGEPQRKVSQPGVKGPRWFENESRAKFGNERSILGLVFVAILAASTMVAYAHAYPPGGSAFASGVLSVSPSPEPSSSPAFKSFLLVVGRQGFNGTRDGVTLTVNEGDHVKITFVYQDAGSGDRHIIFLQAFEIETKAISERNKMATLEFVAGQPGKFKFYCVQPCDGHELLQSGLLEVVRSTAANRDTFLSLAAPELATHAKPVILSAKVSDANNEPVGGVLVDFYSNTTFGLVKLGSASTDAKGVANLNHTMSSLGRVEILASFGGSGRFKPSNATAVMTASAQLGEGELSQVQLYSLGQNAMLDLRAIGSPLGAGLIVVAIVLSIVASVWSTYAYVIYQLVLVGRSGKRRK